MLTHCLAAIADLNDSERSFLQNCDIEGRYYQRGDTVFSEGADHTGLFLCVSGWGARFRLLEDGQRQIVDFIMPGSMFGAQVDKEGRHTVSADALHDLSLAVINELVLREIADKVPSIASRIAIALQDESSRLLERIVSLGRRDAQQRLGHFLLELNERQSAISGIEQSAIRLPIPQQEVADFLGLTSVHVSRTLGQMRDEGLIDYDDREITIMNPDRLAEICEFETHQVNALGIPQSLRRALLACD